MAYTLSEAARAAGRGKTTLLRMIRSGRLSAIRDPVTDGWMIEPAELHRLYPPAHREPVSQADHGAPRIDALEARIEAAETRIRDKDELIAVNAGEKMRRRAGVKMHHGNIPSVPPQARFPVRLIEAAFRF
jgi:hypothetical protein